ncbi:hypothetical protein B484DRAFT_422981 [Ochromonadaceae sp. CCMP2298]|nr:hypothetical protein B484DRAFT_422981 [Ochromonadaceae sp. CCMP2298]
MLYGLSDSVYASLRVPDHLREDSELWGECLSGALYWNDFLHLAKSCGFADPRLVEDAGITVDNAAMEEQLSGIDFYSATYRLWKVPGLEGDCEEYGQTVIYRGTMPEPLLLTAQGKGMVPKLKKEFALDGHHVFKAGKAHNVCGNTWRMLRQTRFAEHFTFVGDFSKHFGIFEGCGVQQPFSSGTKGGASSGGGSEGGCC